MKIFEKALISGIEILNYIPQRDPIVMVDAFYGIKDNTSFSGLTIKEDNIFLQNGHFNESGIIEHIAQSCALRVGYLCQQAQTPTPIGYIGAIKNMTIDQLPIAGQQLYTTVTIEQEVFDITLVSAKVNINDRLIASCEMKIFLDKKS